MNLVASPRQPEFISTKSSLTNLSNGNMDKSEILNQNTDNLSASSSSSSLNSNLTYSNPSDFYPKNKSSFTHFAPHHLHGYTIYVKHTSNKPIEASYVGKLLISKFPNGIKELFNVNHFKVAVISDNRSIINNVLDNPIFSDKGLSVFIPFHLYTRQVIVRRISKDITMKEVVDFGSSEGNTKIVSARRLNRKTVVNNVTNYEASTTIVITVDSKVCPKFFYLYSIRYDTDLYRSKPIQCFNCFKFGHRKNNCNSNSVCSQCGENHNLTIHCPNIDKVPVCSNCKNNHKPTDPIRPVTLKQTKIFYTAMKMNISIDEAKKLVNNSFHNSQRLILISIQAFHQPLYRNHHLIPLLLPQNLPLVLLLLR